MTKDELVNRILKREPLLANAVSNMVDYISDHYPAAYPNHEQTEAVNAYLHSVLQMVMEQCRSVIVSIAE